MGILTTGCVRNLPTGVWGLYTSGCEDSTHRGLGSHHRDLWTLAIVGGTLPTGARPGHTRVVDWNHRAGGDWTHRGLGDWNNRGLGTAPIVGVAWTHRGVAPGPTGAFGPVPTGGGACDHCESGEFNHRGVGLYSSWCWGLYPPWNGV